MFLFLPWSLFDVLAILLGRRSWSGFDTRCAEGGQVVSPG